MQAKKGLVEEAAGGFWNLLVARGLVWIGLEGKGGTAKPTRAKVRGVTLNIHRPFEIQRSSLAWSARLSLCFADSFNRRHDGPRSIVVVVLDALGWAADFRPVLIKERLGFFILFFID